MVCWEECLVELWELGWVLRKFEGVGLPGKQERTTERSCGYHEDSGTGQCKTAMGVDVGAPLISFPCKGGKQGWFVNLEGELLQRSRRDGTWRTVCWRVWVRTVELERTESRMKLGEGNRLGKQGQAGRGWRARVQSRLPIVRGRVVRQRGVMDHMLGMQRRWRPQRWREEKREGASEVWGE